MYLPCTQIIITYKFEADLIYHCNIFNKMSVKNARNDIREEI